MTSIPEPVAEVADLMSTYRHMWCLCGGWAVDAWLGRQTRDLLVHRLQLEHQLEVGMHGM